MGAHAGGETRRAHGREMGRDARWGYAIRSLVGPFRGHRLLKGFAYPVNRPGDHAWAVRRFKGSWASCCQAILRTPLARVTEYM